MARVLAIANQKGGSGKTTTTANLGACLAEMGKKVLLIDLDPQGHLSLYFGLDIEQLECSVYNVLFEPRRTLESVVHRSQLENLHLVPANIDLCGAEIQLVHELGRETVLAEKLEPLRDAYDYILIDCQPSLGLLVINALTASDEVLVPVQSSFLALRGLGMLVETIEKVAARLKPGLHLGGILLTMHDRRTLHCREVAQVARQRFAELVFRTVVHRSVRFNEAPVQGEPITLYAGDTRGAQQYRELAKEVLHGQKACQDRARATG